MFTLLGESISSFIQWSGGSYLLVAYLDSFQTLSLRQAHDMFSFLLTAIHWRFFLHCHQLSTTQEVMRVSISIAQFSGALHFLTLVSKGPQPKALKLNSVAVLSDQWCLQSVFSQQFGEDSNVNSPIYSCLLLSPLSLLIWRIYVENSVLLLWNWSSER
jgi:hypothetical protein